MSDGDNLDWILVHEPWRATQHPDYKKDAKNTVENSLERPQEKQELWDYLELTKIKGIGKEIAEDIGRVFKSEEELIQALKKNGVGLRNDIVKKLNLYFKINKKEEKE